MTSLNIEPGLYRHYKGAYYKVIEVATHSESEEVVVVYQALYGEKGWWVRPLSMFIETVVLETGATVPRFDYIDPQTEVLELALLDIKPELVAGFEAAFADAESIISSMQGYINHSLSRCLENESRYILLVNWQTIQDHEVGFRQSDEYQLWKAKLHHYYEPFPTIEHFQRLR